MKFYYYYRTLTLACIDAVALVVAMSFTYFFLYPKELFSLVDTATFITISCVIRRIIRQRCVLNEVVPCQLEVCQYSRGTDAVIIIRC